MADNNKQQILRGLCAQWQALMDRTHPLPEGGKHGPSEFWRQVRFAQRQDATLDDEEGALLVLADSRAGGTDCPKCGGSGRFTDPQTGRDRGVCFMCKGKGFTSPEDMRRNFGYRNAKPGRQEKYLPGGTAN